VPQFRIHLISEPVSAYEFEDARTLDELCESIVRIGYCKFEGQSNRLGSANQGRVFQTVFAANIARISQK